MPRPYPRPRAGWILHQTWKNLLFAHWPVPMEAMRQVVPSVLPVDEYEGFAWLGIVPFGVEHQRVHGLPEIPGTSRYEEVNVRTYVTIEDRPGVFFLSLDANHRAMVEGARRLMHLRYLYAEIALREVAGEVEFRSRRREDGTAHLSLRYGVSAGRWFEPGAGSFESWLVDRYCSYVVDPRGRVHRGEIDHAPWHLSVAHADIRSNSMASSLGLELGARTPLLHVAARNDVRIWPNRLVRTNDHVRR